ncbi:MAG: hypothetical protein ABJF23_29080 [Bryobacteraceae bacterium]
MEKRDAEITFSRAELDALKSLLGYVLASDAVRPPYSAVVQSVLTKLGLVKVATPEMERSAASSGAPVRMH